MTALSVCCSCGYEDMVVSVVCHSKWIFGKKWTNTYKAYICPKCGREGMTVCQN